MRISYRPTPEGGIMVVRTTRGITRSLKQEITLLRRHVEILSVLLETKEPLGILRLSDRTNYSPHKVRYTLRTLEHEKLIKPSTRGAEVTEELGIFVEDLIRDLSIIRDELNEVYKTVQRVREEYPRQ